MKNYRVTLNSGQSLNVQDHRELEALSQDLCTAGFLIVQRMSSAYTADTKVISILERAVMSIEPA